MKTEASQKKDSKSPEEIKTSKKQWQVKIAQSVTSFFRKYIELFPTNLYSAILATAIFILLENLLHQKIYDVWINPIMSHYKPGYLVDTILLTLVVVLIYKLRHSKLGVIDLTILLVWAYFKTLYEYTEWNFYALSFTHRLSYLSIIPTFYIARLILLWKATKKEVVITNPKIELGYLYPDLSIDAIHKATGEDLGTIDSLKRTGFAKQLADVLKITKSVKSFVVGIEGPWGSGKTSLIYLITEQLRKVEERTFKIIQFSPWFFNNTDNLIASFFDLLEKEFVNNRNIYHELRKYKKQLLSIENNFLKTDFTSLISEDESLLTRYENLESLLQQHTESLVIVIDDLDRLDRKEVIEVFRLMRTIANFPNVFYLVGYDKNYITDAIKKELTEYAPEKYPDKIFNVEFRIPELGFETLQNRFKTSLEERLGLLKQEHQPNEDELNRCFELHDYIKNIIVTERDVVRFINNLMMRYVAIQKEVNLYHLFILELIYYRNSKAYTSVYFNSENIFNQLNNNAGNSFLDISFIPNGDGDDTLQALVSILFNKVDKLKVDFPIPIYDEMYFYRYFGLILPDNQFSDENFEKAFSGDGENCLIILEELYTFNKQQLAHKLIVEFHKKKYQTPNAIEYVIALLKLYKVKALDEGDNVNYCEYIGSSAIFIAIDNELEELVKEAENSFGNTLTLKILSSILSIELCQKLRRKWKYREQDFEKISSYQNKLIQLSINENNNIGLSVQLIQQFWNSRPTETPISRDAFSKAFVHEYTNFFYKEQQRICIYLSGKFNNAIASNQKALLTKEIEGLFGSTTLFLQKKMFWLLRELYSGYVFSITNSYHYPSIDDSNGQAELLYGGKYIIEILPIKERYWKLYIVFKTIETGPKLNSQKEDAVYINKTWNNALGMENPVIDFEFNRPINGKKTHTHSIDASKTIYIGLTATKHEFEFNLLQYDNQDTLVHFQKIPLQNDLKGIKSFSIEAKSHQTDYKLDYKIHKFKYIL